MTRSIPLILSLLLVPTWCAAETVVLKNGDFFEGKISVQTSRSVQLETEFGTRKFDRKEIEEIVDSGEKIDRSKGFEAASPAAKVILNAQAAYDLGDYSGALSRLESLKDFEGNEAIRSGRDWLIIEINEREGKWETAKRLLEEKQENGTPPERIRAKAHLDIFEENPDYDLRFVGEKHARNFILDEKTRNRAKEAGALQDAEIMQLALEEYCEQLLAGDKQSVRAFAEKLDPQATLTALRNLGHSDIFEVLPYSQDLIEAEASIAKARAILGDFGQAFELDLVRTELAHLLEVGSVLFNEALQASPENTTPAFDNRTGRLTPAGRRQWQESCDAFLERARIVTALIDYMQRKVERFPDALRDLREAVEGYSTLFEEMTKSVKRARGRTHV